MDITEQYLLMVKLVVAKHLLWKDYQLMMIN